MITEFTTPLQPHKLDHSHPTVAEQAVDVARSLPPFNQHHEAQLVTMLFLLENNAPGFTCLPPAAPTSLGRL
jgi:hypothetical protein